MKHIILIAIFIYTISLNAQPQVTNLRAAQRNDASKRVDIYYNIEHNRPVTITIQASSDNGESWDLSCRLVTGDVGANISPGRGKHIVWDVLTEHPNISGDEFRFKVHANDVTVPPPPEWMVFVQGGTFSPATNYTVTLSSFYISKYEVTQSDWTSVMGNNPSYFSTGEDAPRRPVERVSWFDAIEYCNRLSIREGLTPAYSYGDSGTNPANWPAGWNTSNANHTNVSCNWNANGYRLLTDMEWEFAAWGGVPAQNAGTFNDTWSGTNVQAQLRNYAWYSANSNSRTHPVGTKLPNELGLYDMSGNVWNWVWDIYGNYPTGIHNNPTGPTTGDWRVLRGGSWYLSAYYCRVDLRVLVATVRFNSYGFRVSRTLN